jgi:hypothetical protein
VLYVLGVLIRADLSSTYSLRPKARMAQLPIRANCTPPYERVGRVLL